MFGSVSKVNHPLLQGVTTPEARRLELLVRPSVHLFPTHFVSFYIHSSRRTFSSVYMTSFDSIRAAPMRKCLGKHLSMNSNIL